jgi:hypothetical protein
MKKTIDDYILEGFKGSRNSETFTNFSDDEYIGYVTAMTVVNYGSKISMSASLVIFNVRHLMYAGKLK